MIDDKPFPGATRIPAHIHRLIEELRNNRVNDDDTANEAEASDGQ